MGGLFAASNVDMVSKIREMAIVNPEERASAAQMLVKYYDGIRLSTPRNQVPTLTSNPPKIAAARCKQAPPPCLTQSMTAPLNEYKVNFFFLRNQDFRYINKKKDVLTSP